MHGPARVNLRRSTFFVPMLLAVMTSVGLVVALLGDGLAHAVSWLGLGAPVLITVWALRHAYR